MKRRLIVFRHAKADRGAMADHERPLTGRGRRDALAAGRWLADNGFRPDLTVCSTAARARETWALAAVELGEPIPTSYERGVYEADLDDLIRIVRDTPAEVRTLLLVGHNPGFQDLVLCLAGDAEGGALAAARTDFGTAALAVLALPVPWADVATGQGTLTQFTVARGER
jgi:phosphohistidine phosphatase